MPPEPLVVVVVIIEHCDAVAAVVIVDALRVVFSVILLLLVCVDDRVLPVAIVRLVIDENSAVAGLQEFLEGALLVPSVVVPVLVCFQACFVDRAALAEAFDEVESRVGLLAVFADIELRLYCSNPKPPGPEDYSTEF